MSGLPSGWVSGSLGDVLRIRNGYAFKSTEFKEAGVPLVRQSNLDGDQVDLAKCVYLEEKHLVDRAGFALQKGDVLIGMSGSVGKLCTYDQDFVALQNQRVGKIELHSSEYTEWRFVWHFLKTITDALLEKAKGVAVANVSPGDIQSLPMDIPPLAEQTRIAAKLDELLAQVDTLKARIDGIPALLKRFRQSVLTAAVSGRLTEEWRGSSDGYAHPKAVDWKWPEIPVGWHVKPYSELVDSRLGKMLDKAKNSGVATKYLGNINVRWFDFGLSEVQEILVSEAERMELAVSLGDVLICEGGEPGRCAIWDARIDGVIVFQKALHRARVKGELIPEWLVFNLKHDADSLALEQLFTGTTIKHLTGKALRKYPMRIPPIEEQIEIVRRVEQLFAFADQLEARVNEARSRIDRLTQSILAKAFRGELVPQNPEDEPASVLLKRIQAQRAATPTAKRGRKKVTSP